MSWEKFKQGLGLFGGGLAVGDAYNRLSDIGNLSEQRVLGTEGYPSEGLANVASEMSQFRPFGVTSNTGSVQTTPEGGFNMQLSGQQAGVQDQLTSGAMGLFNRATDPANDPNLQRLLTEQRFNQTDPTQYSNTAQNKMNAFGLGNQMLTQAGMGTQAREQDVFSRMMAMQAPEQQRQQLALEERLANQGRMGVRTSMFGGTPEQFAMQQAQSEAQNQAAMMAMQQAQAEQAQQANIGLGASQLGQAGVGLQQQMASQNVNDILNILGIGQSGQQLAGQLGQGMLQGSYMPQAALLNQLQAGTQVATLADAGRRQGAELYGQAGMSALEADLGARLGQANLMGQLGTGLLGGASQSSGLFSGLFGDFSFPNLGGTP